MAGKRILIHSIFLLLLPIAVAWFGISSAGAVALVIVALAWRWAITLSSIAIPTKVPELELETISVSHFAEKVRWCMDRLGIDYAERQVGATLGAFFTGRTVPQLKIHTGIVRSVIGNSPDILRYLYGRHMGSLGYKAAFLTPTEERLALESRIDRYGEDLQAWLYYYILPDRKLTQHAWGCNNPLVPTWQRYTVIALFPLLRFLIRKTFRISDANHAEKVKHIGELLADMEARLGDGRRSILGDNQINYVDITLASISGLWLQPKGYGGGKADAVRMERDRIPHAMCAEIERWSESYPMTTTFVERLYRVERQSQS